MLMSNFRTAWIMTAMALLLAVPAVSQEDNAKINDDLDWHWFMMPEDYEPLPGTHWGWLNQGNSATFDVWLTPGYYGVVGACDEDCTDLDLVVTGATEAGLDRAMDDFPYVMFETSTEGYFHFTVEMAACSREPCGWGAEVYRAL